jgi:hypothetical protein
MNFIDNFNFFMCNKKIFIMKKYIIVSCAAFLMIVLCHHHAHAQTPTQESAVETQDQAAQDQADKKMVAFKRMKVSGIVLTSCGLGLFVPGIALTVTGAIMVAVDFVLLQWHALSGWGAVCAAGVILTSVGGAALLSGIPLWVVGAMKGKKYKKIRAALRPLLSLDPFAGTVTLGMGLAF